MTRNRSTKIVATLGPASPDGDVIDSLYQAGADLFRLNLSHGSYADHLARLQAIRRVESKNGRPIGVVLDLHGPKLRVSTFEEGRATLRSGDSFVFDQDPTPGNIQRVCLPHPEIFAAVAVDDILLVNDGLLRFRVTEASVTRITTEVIVGGIISDRKGVNVPGVTLPLPALTTKGRSDLDFGLNQGVDWVALSFEDIYEARSLIGT